MRIVVIASYAGSLITFRGELLKAMVARGHEVTALAPDESERVTSALSDVGVAFRQVPMSRTGVDPREDLGTARALYGVLRDLAPDVVLAYTAKPVIYGLLAARLARVPLRAALISGRGSALAGGSGGKRRALARVMGLLYAIALRGAHVVFFQNPDDERFFRDAGLVGRGQRRVPVAGSGVDLAHYAQASLPDGPMTFLLMGRLLREKGVFEYVEAARAVKALHPDVRFLLLGSLDTNPTAIDEPTLERLQTEGTIEYLGSVDDVRPVIAGSHAVVLPSYHEGMPRSVLEGLAMGRAIITTDVPGCRETVVPGRNGLLVPRADATALAAAMVELVEAPREQVAAMGIEGRALAVERFDVHEVNRTILAALNI